MQCHFCHNLATVHLTDFVQKKKRELHLCSTCAHQQQIVSPDDEALDLPHILELLADHPADVIDEGQITCPHCSTSYAKFRAEGRMGCPHDYAVFLGQLEPLLERIHRQPLHGGKIPSRHRIAQDTSLRSDLEARLRQAVSIEAYDEAARLRDLLLKMRQPHESR